MAKKSKSPAQLKLEARLHIFIVFTIQLFIIAYTAFNSPFVADNLSSLIFANSLFNGLIMLYSLDIKNVKGWWNKRWLIAQQKALHKQEIEDRLRKERELGYDTIKR